MVCATGSLSGFSCGVVLVVVFVLFIGIVMSVVVVLGCSCMLGSWLFVFMLFLCSVGDSSVGCAGVLALHYASICAGI